MELRPDDIQEILRVFAESPIEELHLEIGNARLHVSKKSGTLPSPAGNPAAPSASAPEAASASRVSTATAMVAEPTRPSAEIRHKAGAAPPGDEHLYELRSPLLGIFYRRPAPGEPPFVDVGTEVEPKDAVCLVDVMKMFTRVEAGIAGRIAEICVEDGQLVEHGQVLMRIEPV